MAAKEEIAAIELEFMEAWESGSSPTLQDYVARYPRYVIEITEFVLDLLALEGALTHTPSVAQPSAMADQAVARALQSVFTPVENLKQARRALGWTPTRLAQELNLPNIMVFWLEGGNIVETDTRLEAKLSYLIGRTPSQTRALLNAPAPPAIPATHHMATGTPHNSHSKTRTFREALEECERQGQLTEDQRREWLSQTNVGDSQG